MIIINQEIKKKNKTYSQTELLRFQQIVKKMSDDDYDLMVKMVTILFPNGKGK